MMFPENIHQCPKVWCSGELTPTANPPDWNDITMTLVYFDLEATGLKSSGRPIICELSLLAVNFQDVSDFNIALIASLDNGRSESYLLQVR